MGWLITRLAHETSVYTDDVWAADSSPVECAWSRETAHRSDLAGHAEYGYCASDSLSSGDSACTSWPHSTACPWGRADRRGSRRLPGPAGARAPLVRWEKWVSRVTPDRPTGARRHVDVRTLALPWVSRTAAAPGLTRAPLETVRSACGAIVPDVGLDLFLTDIF